MQTYVLIHKLDINEIQVATHSFFGCQLASTHVTNLIVRSSCTDSKPTMTYQMINNKPYILVLLTLGKHVTNVKLSSHGCKVCDSYACFINSSWVLQPWLLLTFAWCDGQLVFCMPSIVWGFYVR